MKLLIYGNRKQDDDIYLIATPEQEAAAYLAIFKDLDEHWGVYTELTAKEQLLYDKAKAGDWEAAKRLMNGRKDYEYEYEEIRTASTMN